jgi:hypothetical protein
LDASILQEIKAGIASASEFSATEATTLPAYPTPITAALDAIARSCRVKAEACNWAVERQKLIVAGADFSMEVEPRDRELIEKASGLEDDCLWMLTKTAPMPESLELYLELAERYENAADAANLLAELVQQNDEQEMLEDAMSLGAEAQAALRQAVWKIGYTETDPSQYALYHWLIQTGQDRHVYLDRYMQGGDKPEKSEIESLGGRIANFKADQGTHAEAKEQTANKLNTIRTYLSQIWPGRNNAHDWNNIFAVIEEIVPEYLQPNDIRLRELLINFVDDIPEETDVSQAGQEVLCAIDHYLATRPEVAPVQEARIELSPEVAMVKEKLKGRTIVIIGGEARPDAKDALRSGGLRWHGLCSAGIDRTLHNEN